MAISVSAIRHDEQYRIACNGNEETQYARPHDSQLLDGRIRVPFVVQVLDRHVAPLWYNQVECCVYPSSPPAETETGTLAASQQCDGPSPAVQKEEKQAGTC
ncbi:hypothetical protein E4U53_001674 [Claviceps sorghi]|nr:hypothetical protein E4U53_001674 [Claviceps sorghi]